jgi:hypothetical protein
MLSAVEAGTFDDARALLARLGAKWSPGSRAAVEKWLTRAASGPR